MSDLSLYVGLKLDKTQPKSIFDRMGDTIFVTQVLELWHISYCQLAIASRLIRVADIDLKFIIFVDQISLKQKFNRKLIIVVLSRECEEI